MLDSRDSEPGPRERLSPGRGGVEFLPAALSRLLLSLPRPSAQGTSLSANAETVHPARARRDAAVSISLRQSRQRLARGSNQPSPPRRSRALSGSWPSMEARSADRDLRCRGAAKLGLGRPGPRVDSGGACVRNTAAWARRMSPDGRCARVAGSWTVRRDGSKRWQLGRVVPAGCPALVVRTGSWDVWWWASEVPSNCRRD